MGISQESGANELVGLIENAMRESGIKPKVQIGRLKGPVTSRKRVDGAIFVGRFYGKHYDKSSLYRVITAQGLSISGSIFGPHPDCVPRDIHELELVRNVDQVLRSNGYSLYQR